MLREWLSAFGYAIAGLLIMIVWSMAVIGASWLIATGFWGLFGNA